ncbi:Maf1 regulator-domain-containing protein [Pseudomassariella vexata]|uniref:Repressor of RNA polymerase III transcription MAF1 n=1 Tax=Pseudomassariella vexata TaxID=1141098 RepID=A0A1Y2DJU3_9PEZI|nr:Maf1 regulator-domain-containing protein [Pseudomassariella vexata]ORY59517.1 Maf1 regulator-domain-containing protein [Pseudomassariella vexata]
MKFLPLRDFDIVTSALNFTTPDCRVTGGCDLYATKAAGSDKKLYKNIDRSLESQHAALLKFGASLSPPQREKMEASLNLSRSSPFGSLSDTSSRRTFAYLIATLNASHPDYDFSHVLRPNDFRKEWNLPRVMASIDSTLNNVRPHAATHLSPNITSAYNPAHSATVAAPNGGHAISSPAWGPQMWSMMDKEMKLKDCTCFSYQPADDPFDGEESAIWRMHYFFFNKALKRVAYLYVRGVPAIVHSPALGPHGMRRGSSSVAKRQATATLSSGANKRAKFWLGDRYADTIITVEDDDDDYDDNEANAIMWDPDEDVDIDPLNAPSSPEASDDEYFQEDSEDESDEASIARSPVRGVSEDIASRMDIE